jgi:hypothetical protein
MKQNTADVLAKVEAKIEALQEVAALLRGESKPSKKGKGTGTGTRTLSRKARKAISDAQKARWAKKKKTE